MEDTQDLSACVTKLQENVLRWEHRVQSEPGRPAAFRQAVEELRAGLDDIGRASFQRLAQACEIADDTMVADGRVYRFKQVVDKEWMTLWGKVVMPRRLYQADRGGPSRVPMDERCGMSGRFMVPELERVTAFLGARLVPAEVEDSLGEMLPESPSRTAIQHVLTTVGQCAEEGAEQLELALETAAPLNAEGDTLVVSWDGVTVPLREPAPKRGRPAERPMATDVDTAPTAWKEAGVGMVATYLTPLDPAAEEPQRIDVRYAARMPEAKMATLVNGLVDQTTRALQHGCFHERVVLADGKREIWRTVDELSVFDGFTRILDFYHAAQHLSKAAEHLFGKASAKADRWYRSWRHKLRHEPGAVDGLLRSLSYHRRKLRRRSERYRQATTELGYFRNNRDKMDYARYHASGLIISSGPVEAAAKTIVGHRLNAAACDGRDREASRSSTYESTFNRNDGMLSGTGTSNRPQPREGRRKNKAAPQSKRWDAFWNWYLQQTTPITTLKRAA